MQSEMVYIALGSNLGASQNLILSAMDRLMLEVKEPLLRSSLWLSHPIDCPEGSSDFVNAVIGYEIPRGEDPLNLLRRLQTLESDFGRPGVHRQNSPRILDLDIICFGTMVMQTPDLIIPHPRAKERAFVLLPLQEIAPTLVFPEVGLTVTDLVARLTCEGIERL